MGMLFRMFAPKPLKKARRAAHPVSLMTPRPVRKAKMAAVNTTHPAGAAKRAAERAAVRKVRGRAEERGYGWRILRPSWLGQSGRRHLGRGH